ncbi:substrate-binding domain-containing protein [Salinisphaera orenii]|uniref:substrate-binding domain-containing protein n=1 Tax=Salinisphaera orenii TaxID=856731 RepID=UPI0013A65A3F|nr:substrate-binding domain-containing protein [Salifodinibacter halophilus]
MAGGIASSATAGSSSGASPDVSVGMVLKTLSNPYFGAMQSAAQKEAKAKGVDLTVKAGRYDGDVSTQISAVQTFISRGVDAIAIVPNVSSGLGRALKKAKQQGIAVIAVDTTVKPKSLSSSFVATNNLKAGKLNGKWVKQIMKGEDPVVTLLEGTPSSSVNRDRMNGFLNGFGMEKSDANIDLITHGDRGKAQTAMENALAKNPNINLVWTINEPAALGAAAAIREFGKTGEVTIVSMDGSCRGIRAVKAGKIDTDVMQFPSKMAAKAIDLSLKAARGEDIPSRIDTGEVLITQNPQDGVPSKGVEYGLKHCWGS